MRGQADSQLGRSRFRTIILHTSPSSKWGPVRSEQELESELKLSGGRIGRRRGYRAICIVADYSVWKCEVRGVRHVEAFHAELQPQGLPQCKIPDQRQVQRPLVRSAQLVRCFVAGSSLYLWRECRCIEPHVQAGTGCCPSCDSIRTVRCHTWHVLIGNGIGQRKRQSRLPVSNPIGVPTLQDVGGRTRDVRDYRNIVADHRRNPLADTFALGTTAPDVSVTVPRMLAVVTCA